MTSSIHLNVVVFLQIIRGRTLFKLNVHDDEFALIVTLSKMNNLELPALRGNNNLILFSKWKTKKEREN